MRTLLVLLICCSSSFTFAQDDDRFPPPLDNPQTRQEPPPSPPPQAAPPPPVTAPPPSTGSLAEQNSPRLNSAHSSNSQPQPQPQQQQKPADQQANKDAEPGPGAEPDGKTPPPPDRKPIITRVTTVTELPQAPPRQTFDYDLKGDLPVPPENESQTLKTFCQDSQLGACAFHLKVKTFNFAKSARSLQGTDASGAFQYKLFSAPMYINRKGAIDFLNQFAFDGRALDYSRAAPPKGLKRTSSMKLDGEWMAQDGATSVRALCFHSTRLPYSYIVVIVGASDKSIVSSEIFKFMYQNFDVARPQ